MRRLVVLSMVVAAVLGVSVAAGAQEAYCTLGQYVWGHETREFNGIPLPALLDNLITGRMPSGVYFVRMTATATASGRAYSQTGKMLVVR